MKNRSQLAMGLILILLGVWFIAQRQVSALNLWVGEYMVWPMNLLGIGLAIFLVGLLVGSPGMAIPAAVVSGIGGIFIFQEVYKVPNSWPYMWTLIPGFVGVGNIIAGLLSRDMDQARSGLKLIVTSAVLFVIFTSIFGPPTFLGAYGPAVLFILLGIWFLVRGFINRGRE